MALFLTQTQVIHIVVLIITLIHVKNADWDYNMEGETGPLHWHDDFAHCGGDTQSPIAIHNDDVQHDLGKCRSFHWEETPGKKQFLLKHNNRSLEIIPIDKRYRKNDTNSYYLTNRDNTIAKFSNQFRNNTQEHQTYCLHSVHFHWGSNDNSGSEHTINDQSYALEAHFVHYSCDYYNLQDALNNIDNTTDKYVLAVLGVLYKVGNPNIGFEYLIKNQTMSHLLIPNSEYEMELDVCDMDGNNINIFDHMLPRNRNFYHYKGSLTTPPCLPVVNWHVFTDVMTVSTEQLSYFRKMMDMNNEPLDHNWRPTRNNNNQVFLCTNGSTLSFGNNTITC